MMIISDTYLIFPYSKDKFEAYEEKFKRITQEQILLAKESLNELDLEILNLIHNCKITTSLQIQKLTKVKLDKTIRRRIAKLYDLGCIDAFRPYIQKGTSPIHCVVGPVGARILDIKGFRRMRTLNQNWKHTIAVNETYANLSVKFDVKSWEKELKLTWEDEATREKHQQPDAFIHYINSKGRTNYAMIEVDMGTESIDVLVEKVKNYIEYFNGNEFKRAKWQPRKNIAIIPEVFFIMKYEKDALKLKTKILKMETNIGFKVLTFESIS